MVGLSKIKVILISTLFTLTILPFTNVFAEYYLVSGRPLSLCMACTTANSPSRPCVQHKPKSVKKHFYHHQYHYSPPPTSICAATCTTCGRSYKSSGSFIDFSSRPNSSYAEYYYHDDYWNYDPDLSTGDDDPIIYPDMDIDE